MNLLATILYKLGNAAACGDSSLDFDSVLHDELQHLNHNDTVLHNDLRQLREVIGYLSQRLTDIEINSRPQQEPKIIKMK